MDKYLLKHKIMENGMECSSRIFTKLIIPLVNYPRPEGHGFVTAQSY